MTAEALGSERDATGAQRAWLQRLGARLTPGRARLTALGVGGDPRDRRALPGGSHPAATVRSGTAGFCSRAMTAR